jgi:biotin carboxyl carrier protein
MVEPGTPICRLEISTGAYTDGPEAETEVEAYARGIIHWATIAEGDIVKQGQVIGWFDTE